MKRLCCLILLCLPLLLVTRPLMAMVANGCDDYVEPTVTVKQLVISPNFNDTLDLANIRRLAVEGGQNLAGTKHETPVGLTTASLKLDSRFQISIKKKSNDAMVCAQISIFDLNFGFDDTTVYLARELPNGSCAYQTVMEHELNHVQTDRYLVQSYVPVLSNLLRKAVRDVGMIRASSPETAEQEIRASINQYMGELGKNLSQVRQNYQSKIDTPQEYERLSRSCNNALSRLIKDAGLNESY